MRWDAKSLRWVDDEDETPSWKLPEIPSYTPPKFEMPKIAPYKSSFLSNDEDDASSWKLPEIPSYTALKPNLAPPDSNIPRLLREHRTFEPVESTPIGSHELWERHEGNTFGIRNVGEIGPRRVFEQTPVGLRELNPYQINQRGHQNMLDRLTNAFNPFDPPWNPFKP